MKNIVTIASAIALAAMSTSAMAATGRVEVNAGVQNVTKAPQTNDVTYGATVGVDADLVGPVFVGVQATVDNVFDNRNLGVGARVGVHATESTDLYVVGSYANYVDAFDRRLDGLRVGAGFETKVVGPVYLGAEYRYSDFQKGVGSHGALAKVGIKF